MFEDRVLQVGYTEAGTPLWYHVEVAGFFASLPGDTEPEEEDSDLPMREGDDGAPEVDWWSMPIWEEK